MFNRPMNTTWIEFLTEPAVIFWFSMAAATIILSFTNDRKKK